MENRPPPAEELRYGRKTLRQLARSLDVDVREVSKAARLRLGLGRDNVRDPAFTLSPRQCRQVADVLGKRPRPTLPGLAGADDVPEPGPRSRTGLRFRPDRPTASEPRPRGLRHQVWLHPEVSDRLRGWTHLYKRLGIVLQHLAAHGRTTVVKGCGDGNQGWRRSPLGGHNGMQYYLWWTPGGSRAAPALDVPEGAILVRDVRHHDDHAPLEAGGADAFLPLATSDDLNEDQDIAGSPWTDDQMEFVEDESPVRLILGRPGSGKTTVLWKAIEARGAERVLYLTWSSALTRHAEERFASFAPADVEVVARDFTTFVGEVCGADVPRQPLAASRAKFDGVLTRLGRDMAGPWARRQDALHAELRGVFFGRAVPGDRGCANGPGIARLKDDAYRDLRVYEGVGDRAAKALLKVAQRLARDRERVEAVFPELVAATRAVERLRNGEVPAGYDGFDRIVVDEVQDLTLLETTVVVELCHAVARSRGRAPWLLMAGDTGQTVRPTWFEWGPLSDLLARRVHRPQEFHLEEHLRCPARIAEVMERASRHYTSVYKEVRPTRQRRQRGGQHVDAQLVHVHVPDRAEAVRLLERLDDTDDVVVLSPRNEAPAWVPPELRGVVLTPEEAKGLEYQSVCVLDPGRLLTSLAESTPEYGGDEELDQPARRTAIDHLRVTLSRATETLVFVDVEAGEDDVHASRMLLGEAAPYDAEDLVDHLTHDDASAEERVLARTADARALIDSAPRRAWQRACQAMRLLGEPDLPNGVSDRAVRADAHATLLATAARLLVEGVPKGVVRLEVLEMARSAVRAAEGAPQAEPFDGVREEAAGGWPDAPVGLASAGGRRAEMDAITCLDSWTMDRSAPPFDLLRAARRLEDSPGGGDWLGAALLSAAQGLREGLKAGAENPNTAASFAGADVEAWLRLTGYAGDAADRARELRGKAFDTLLKDGGAREPRADRRTRLARAESVLETIAPALLGGGRGPDVGGTSVETNSRGRAAAAPRGRGLAAGGMAGSRSARTTDPVGGGRGPAAGSGGLSGVKATAPDLVRLGRLREAQERPEDAVKAYERAGRRKDVLRVLRNSGAWERAVALADDEIRADLEWLIELQALVERRPPQQNRRLRNAERDRLEKLLDVVQKRPSRRTASGA